MSNLIRFEFYNNFDIWYDLYQENGGDPNLYLNMIKFTIHPKYPRYEFGHGYSGSDMKIIGSGYTHSMGEGFLYGIKIGRGQGFQYGYGCGHCNIYKKGDGTA